MEGILSKWIIEHIILAWYMAIIMTKKEFIKKLKLALCFQISADELKKTISEYENYFDKAIAMGKSEEAIVAEYGDIALIATEIAKEKGDGLNRNFFSVHIKVFIAIAILLLFGGLITVIFSFQEYLNSNSNGFLLPLYMIACPCLISVVLSEKGMFKRKTKIDKRVVLYMFICVGVCVAAWFITWFLVNDCVRNMIGGESIFFTTFNIKPEKISSLLYTVFYILSFVLTIAGIFAIVLFKKLSIYFMAVFFLSSSVQLIIFQYNNFLMQMDDIAIVYEAISYVNYNMLFGAVVTAVVFIAIVVGQRKAVEQCSSVV